MTAPKDLTGQRFDMLVVLRRTGSDKNKNSTWLCKCDCGATCEVDYRSLVEKGRKSCGCARRRTQTTRAEQSKEAKARKKNQQSIRDIAKAAAEAGMSYGEYVTKCYQNS